MKVTEKYIIVQSDVTGLVVSEYIDSAQIWTGNQITESDTVQGITVTGLTSTEVDKVIQCIADCDIIIPVIELENEPRTDESNEAIEALKAKGTIIITVAP